MQGTGPRERSMLQSAKPEGGSHLSLLTSELDIQDEKSALLHFNLDLVDYFLTMPPIPTIWNGNVYSVPLCIRL